MSYVRTITIVVILVITSVLILAVSRSERKVLNKPFALFPEEIKNWKGVKGTLDQEIYNILGVEDYILANYKNQKGVEQQIVLYWFQSRGRIISSEYMQKIWLVVDSITKQRTDGAFVRLISPIIENEQVTVDLLKEFAKQIKPILDDHIPS